MVIFHSFLYVYQRVSRFIQSHIHIVSTVEQRVMGLVSVIGLTPGLASCLAGKTMVSGDKMFT